MKHEKLPREPAQPRAHAGVIPSIARAIGPAKPDLDGFRSIWPDGLALHGRLVNFHKWLKKLARPRGVEPLTPRSVVWCSIQLSYGRVADTEAGRAVTTTPARGG
jgi:hypothetical protein